VAASAPFPPNGSAQFWNGRARALSWKGLQLDWLNNTCLKNQKAKFIIFGPDSSRGIYYFS
jgi:hypothetical protein